MKEDSGWKDRKFVLVVLALGLCTSIMLVLDFFPAAQSVFGIYIGAVNGLCALYIAGNVGSLHVSSNASGTSVDTKEPDNTNPPKTS